VRRLLTGLAGALGAAALWRLFASRRPAPPPAPAPPPPPLAGDPAEELRRRLAEAREATDDRDDYDSAEGMPVDEVDEPHSLDERRKQVHDQAQQALDRMHREPQD
jgi:hypothetical protein